MLVFPVKPPNDNLLLTDTFSMMLLEEVLDFPIVFSLRAISGLLLSSLPYSSKLSLIH